MSLFSGLPERIQAGVDTRYWRRRRWRVVRRAVAAISLSCVALQGQIRLLYYSRSTRKDGAPTEACLLAGRVAMSEAGKFPRPKDWRVLVVCDDVAWVDVMQRMYGQPGLNVYGATDPDAGLTVLRGTTLLGLTREHTPEELVSHELAHLAKRSRSEPDAEQLSAQWRTDWHRAHDMASVASGGGERGR